MKILYDRQTDTLCVIFREEQVQESDELKEGVIVDYDRQGYVVSLELLNASRHVSDPDSIAYEIKHAGSVERQ